MEEPDRMRREGVVLGSPRIEIQYGPLAANSDEPAIQVLDDILTSTQQGPHQPEDPDGAQNRPGAPIEHVNFLNRYLTK